MYIQGLIPRNSRELAEAVPIVLYASSEQGSKIALVRSYLRVPQAAGQLNILIFLVEINFFPYMQKKFVMQGKCLF